MTRSTTKAAVERSDSKGGCILVDDRRFVRASGRELVGLGENGDVNEETWRSDFWFAQLADTQLGLYDESGRTWDEEVDMILSVAKTINTITPRPAFVCVCGDLTNSMPNGHGADPELQTRQVASFKEAMSAFAHDIPLVCMCGNHDVGDRPTKFTIEAYKSRFGDDYYSFWSHGCKFVVINTSLHSALEEGRYSFDAEADSSAGKFLEDPESAVELKHQLEEVKAMAAKQDVWLEKVLSVSSSGQDGGRAGAGVVSASQGGDTDEDSDSDRRVLNDQCDSDSLEQANKTRQKVEAWRKRKAREEDREGYRASEKGIKRRHHGECRDRTCFLFAVQKRRILIGQRHLHRCPPCLPLPLSLPSFLLMHLTLPLNPHRRSR